MSRKAHDPVVREIEEAFVAHWSLLGGWPGARLEDADGLLRFETPVRKLPYNGVIRTAIAGDPAGVVARVVDAYRSRGSQFFWLVHPSAAPHGLPDVLSDAGLTPVERAVGMSLELAGRAPAARTLGADVEIAEVTDETGLRAYEDIVLDYWELDEADRVHVSRLNRHWYGERARGKRWIVLLEGRPVGKGYLSFAGPPGVAAIYGMSVRPAARGRGVASLLTGALVDEAARHGCRRIVLHSSEMAVGVYRRAGFEARCDLTFFATDPIWSGKH